MKQDTRKLLGQWGENFVDDFMEKYDWQIIQKNQNIHKGEIDRVYFSDKHNQYCICEIKTSYLERTNLKFLFENELYFKKFLKFRQIRNLYWYTNNFPRYLPQLKNSTFNFLVRYFIVLKGKPTSQKQILEQYKNCRTLKICRVNSEGVIIAVTPEFTNYLTKKSSLECYIHQ